ncbi:MarR family transcriptional regulator [Amycolatopsis acidicola]|uniref:MarR family transcriptional regulator n=1 Tax=Amycolatopsis acidicola TaxID=2596893 RepID=A0A5N0V4U9_9PSEU|nr:MarR family transcriptional regulator [Amycolatopsis acidicola]KAA9159089.1 MarR family transcriptional regulator [Amycolatopsis acidicola]
MTPVAPEGVFSAAELDVADELGVQLIRLVGLVAKSRPQVVAAGPGGIEQAAYAILLHLIHEGPQRISKIADALHSEISTVSRQGSALVRHGLAERRADPEDGRAYLLVPTLEGLRVFEENRKRRNKWLAGALAGWSQEDREVLAALLGRLTTGIEGLIPQFADATSAQGERAGS